MKFSCERDTLLNEIIIAQEIISSRNILSILSNVLLMTDTNNLIIRASDLKVIYESMIPIDVIIQGCVTVYCDKFLSILRALPEGEIEFEILDNMIFSIKPVFKKIEFKMKSIPPENFPEIPNANADTYFEFSQLDFLEMIKNTIFAISDDETRYFMNGVFVEKIDNTLIMVASDGRRLSYVIKKNEQKIPEFSGIIIPQKILNILKKLMSGEGKLSIAITEKHIFFKFNNHKFVSNLIEGKFPNYQKVIPEKHEYKAKIERKIFENAIKRVSLLAEQKSRRIYLSLKNNTVIITSDKSEIGMAQEEINCDYNGPEGIIVLNYIYILEPLKEITEDIITLEFTDMDKTIKIASEPPKEFTHIIMPMQKK